MTTALNNVAMAAKQMLQTQIQDLIKSAQDEVQKLSESQPSRAENPSFQGEIERVFFTYKLYYGIYLSNLQNQKKTIDNIAQYRTLSLDKGSALHQQYVALRNDQDVYAQKIGTLYDRLSELNLKANPTSLPATWWNQFVQ